MSTISELFDVEDSSRSEATTTKNWPLFRTIIFTKNLEDSLWKAYFLLSHRFSLLFSKRRNCFFGKWGSGLVGSFPAIFSYCIFQAKMDMQECEYFWNNFFHFLRIGFQVLGQFLLAFAS